MLIRLYLVPETDQPQRILDVPKDDLVLDKDGQYRLPGLAQYVALRQDGVEAESFVKICWRETVDQDDPDYAAPVIAPDPTAGEECICLLTCSGVKVPVQTTVVDI